MENEFDLVELEDEIGGLDFTGSLDENGFGSVYDETQDFENHHEDDFINHDYLITENE